MFEFNVHRLTQRFVSILPKRTYNDDEQKQRIYPMKYVLETYIIIRHRVKCPGLHPYHQL